MRVLRERSHHLLQLISRLLVSHPKMPVVSIK